MRTDLVIKHLHPSLRPGLDVLYIQDVYGNVHITQWNNAAQLPTEADLQANEAAALAARYDELKVSYAGAVIATVKAFEDGLMPVEKRERYRAKQLAFKGWEAQYPAYDGPAPAKAQIEWTGRWEPEATANGYAVVEAAGVQFKCTSPEDLVKTWGLNTKFVDWLLDYSEPIRLNAQQSIETLVPVGEADLINQAQATVDSVLPQLQGLLGTFAISEAPGLIATFGLVMV